MAILTILIAVPAVAGIALMTVRPLCAVAREFALGVAVIEFVLAVGMLMAFDRSAAGAIQFSEIQAWIPQIGASWALGVNGIGLSLIMLSVFLTPLTMLAGWNEDEDESRRAQYYGLILISLAFMVGIFAARDVFLFYVLFEAMLVPVYFLIGSFGGEQRRYAAVKFLIYSLLGGLVMLVAVIGLYFAGPGGEQGFLTANLTGLTYDAPWIENLLFLGFFIAFAIKAPMVPLHTWLPSVAESARAGTTTLLVAVLDKVGVFGMLTLSLTLFPAASKWAAPVIIVLAVISVIYGALAAIGQDNMFRLVAFTSVSHFGIMVLGVFAFTRTSIEGATFYMLSHGLSTGALFLLVGFLVKRHGTASVAAFGGLQRVVPVFAGTFLIVGLSALALPGMAPFASEIMVLIGAYEVTRWGVIIATLGVILAALYILLTYKKVFTGPTPAAMEPTKELSTMERVAVWPLIVAMLVLGTVPALAVNYFKDPAAAIVVSVEEAGQ
ncbi:MAG TPA: NADH-quinone oxidoreductase subunit M [Demequina sp.]|nr:NADH-quinone oxidoreductase subunit M [Demequina sp.]